MAFALIFLPLAMAVLAAATPSNRWRPWLLPITAVAYVAVVVRVLALNERITIPGWLALDPPGAIVLLEISVLFLLCAFYTVGYLRYRQERSNRVFCVCLLAFLGIASLVVWSQHLGVMWVAIEATTLVTAPLIYFNRTPKSIEATWMYLLVGSVGIAMALLGTFFLAYASLHEGLASTLSYQELLGNASQLSKPWLHAAFILLLVGYGTKMGLAPMHTWKPAAYGEAPGVVGAILAGGVTSCAFLAVLRMVHICHAAGEEEPTSRILLFMGIFSMAIAGLFLIGQRDMKRMLAYSSVEHMGILVFGLGIGGRVALFGTLFHVIANGLTKGGLFLSAGNIHRAYGSKDSDHVYGAMRRLPLSGTLFLVGLFAITGSPPFAAFVSEFSILNGAFGTGHYGAGGILLAFLLLVFIGMATTMLKIVQGRPPASVRNTPYRDGLLTGLPVLVLFGLVVMLGLYIPVPLYNLLNEAVQFLESHP